jgi:hypothetical protein
MVLWQFAVITVLIGALLAYAIVLTNRLTFANAALRRIEEALAKAEPVTERVPATAAEATVAEAIQSPQVPLTERRGSYMTVRDLKVIARAGRRGGNEDVDEGLVSSDALNASREQNICSAAKDVVAASSELLETNLESQSVAENSAVIEAASPESHAAMNTSDEPQNAPAARDLDAEVMERRKRDALLIMSAQRRRRRARGY